VLKCDEIFSKYVFFFPQKFDKPFNIIIIIIIIIDNNILFLNFCGWKKKNLRKRNMLGDW
jgi:hypothetical protein